MVNKEQVLQGFIEYIDVELIPKMSTGGKWIIGTFTTLVATKINSIYENLISNQYFINLNIVNGTEIDIDLLTDALITNAQKYGKLIINVPLLGTLSFSDKDISLIKTYITGDHKNE